MLNVEILRNNPMADCVESIGRLDVNMGAFIQVGITQELGQSTEDATSQKLLTDTVKDISNEINSLETELTDTINTKSAQLSSSIDDEVTNRKADSVAIRTAFAHADTMNKEALTALINTKEISLRSEVTNYVEELQSDIDAESVVRKAEDATIRSEFAQADQGLQEAVEVANTAIRSEFAEADQGLQTAVDAEVAGRKAEDASIRGEFAQADQLLQEAITTGEEARKAEDVAIRSEFANADQALRQAVDVADEAIRSEVAKVNQQLQEAINAEQVARQEADTAINEQIDTKADKAPEGQEYALVSAIPNLTPYATKVELTQAITDLINGADADSDTLKELADKITTLAQADNGLVSAEATQTFNETQKKQARDNIEAISEADVNEILEAQLGGGYVSAYLQASQQSGI